MKSDLNNKIKTGNQFSINDDSIVDLLCGEDHVEEGLRLLMKKYGEPIYWYIRRIVVAHEDAEDALQETMINVFKYRGSYSRNYPLSSWLYKDRKSVV